jgi:hypothetical protein
MIKKGKAWEQIEFADSEDSNGQPSHLFRLKVPHGWLVITRCGGELSQPMYVPDGAHIWDPGAP